MVYSIWYTSLLPFLNNKMVFARSMHLRTAGALETGRGSRDDDDDVDGQLRAGRGDRWRRYARHAARQTLVRIMHTLMGARGKFKTRLFAL